MDSISYGITGDRQALAKLTALGQVFSRKVLMKVLYSGARIFVKAIRANIAPHRDTGNLHKSVGIIKGKSSYDPAVLVAVKMGRKFKHDGYYGYFLEKGTKKISALNFFADAVEAKAEEVWDKMNRNLKKEIDRFIKKNRVR